jgi:hypothetical protein
LSTIGPKRNAGSSQIYRRAFWTFCRCIINFQLKSQGWLQDRWRPARCFYPAYSEMSPIDCRKRDCMCLGVFKATGTLSSK